MDQGERDQFERIELIARIERAEELIQQYMEGVRHFMTEIKAFSHKLGRLDERWGG